MSEPETVVDAVTCVDQLLQVTRFAEAESACRNFVSRYPWSSDLRVRWGMIQIAMGHLTEAENQLRLAIVEDVECAARWRERGIRLGDAKGLEGATCSAEEFDARLSTVWIRIGNFLYSRERWAIAVGAYQEAVSANPQDAAAWNNLGSAELRRGRYSQSEAAIQRALTLAPGQSGAAANYAYLLCCQGQPDQAFQWLKQRVVTDVRSADQWVELGRIWESMAEWMLAAFSCRHALEISVDHKPARELLARIMRSQRSITATTDLIRQTVTSEPLPAATWAFYAALFGGLISMQGRSSEGAQYLKRAVELAPNPERHSGYLLALQYVNDITAPDLLAAHRQWNAAYTQSLPPAFSSDTNRSMGNKPLRLGIVSGDFGKSAIRYMAVPGIERLDRSEFHVVWYSDQAQEDENTQRFRSVSNDWRNISNLSNEQLALSIRDDRIDILIDLMGHGGSRLPAFVRRPAPIQMSWLGYAGTTGLDAIDFLIADQFHVRSGEDGWYHEKVLRLPNDYACFAPPDDAPAVTPLPAHVTGCVTFGCFNNPAKYSDRLIAAWAAILNRVANARVLLKFSGLEDPRIQKDIRERAQSHGIHGDRFLFEGWSSHSNLLATYGRIDIALDSFPYSGGLTTCEALWMGVPVVTFPGRTFAGRHSTSHLTNSGYGQFIAMDLAGYIELAVDWANRIDELVPIRPQMRDQMQLSPLCDVSRFIADFQYALSQIGLQHS